MDFDLKIPQKSHFKADELCAITGVKPYVLRFWEAEFSEISPIISASGQKLYEEKDIKAIIMIKKLLFQDKLTIEKAKFKIKELLENIENEPPIFGPEDLEETAKAETSTPDIDLTKIELIKEKLGHLIQQTESIQNQYQ